MSLLLVSLSQTSQAQISKGHWILINRGFQILGLTQPDNYFHLDTYTNAGYTTVAFSFDSTGNLGPIPTFTGEPPGMPWARWAPNETNMPGQGSGYIGGDTNRPYLRANEIPHLSQLVAVQLGDEWNLNDDTTRNRLVDWFNAERTNWPNTILYHNNWGYQIDDAQLADYIARAHPDMINFDTYPWESVWDVNAPNHIGAVIPGPGSFQLKQWYGELRQYREYARAFGIPMGIYRQIWHGVQDYDQHVYRDPSPSELRLNTFGAIAFSAKFLNDFYYNASAGSMFTKIYNGSGDTQISTNGLYAEMAEVNQRVRNLGKTLVRLKPVYDLHNPNTANPPPGPSSDDPNFPNSSTTGIMFLRGKYMTGSTTNFTPVPNSFYDDPSSSTNFALRNSLAYTWWEFGKNDPYLSGFSVTNTAATKNNGLHGDAIIAWFTPLDENLDGPTYSNQVYMMVVNALTDPNGTAADCLQDIKLDFSNLGTGAMTNLIMLDPLTGQLHTNGLPLVSGKRRLTLSLNGGDAALFKFNTGAPFVGFYTQPPQLAANMENGNPAISIQGTIGSRYELQTTSSLSNTNWTSVTNFLLPSSPYVFRDTTSSGIINRFYRVVGIP